MMILLVESPTIITLWYVSYAVCFIGQRKRESRFNVRRCERRCLWSMTTTTSILTSITMIHFLLLFFMNCNLFTSFTNKSVACLFCPFNEIISVDKLLCTLSLLCYVFVFSHHTILADKFASHDCPMTVLRR